MSTPLFFPPARLVERIDTRNAIALRDLLSAAGLRCRASGRWTQRMIVIEPGGPFIEREPGDWGAVRIGVPDGLTARGRTRYAVAAMAYGLMDLVARESVRGAEWARPAAPRGRPRTGCAMSNAQRQRAWRARHAQGTRSAG